MGNGQWAMGNGQWAMGNGQWAMGNGQWAMGNGGLGPDGITPARGTIFLADEVAGTEYCRFPPALLWGIHLENLFRGGFHRARQLFSVRFRTHPSTLGERNLR